MVTVRMLQVDDVTEAGLEQMQALVEVLTARDIQLQLEDVLFAMDCSFVWVAVADGPLQVEGVLPGMIVGMATMVPVATILGRHGIVEDVAVLPACQGMNVASMLIAAIKEHGPKCGMRWLELTSRPSREAAQRLYARMGFKQRETNVWRWTA